MQLDCGRWPITKSEDKCVTITCLVSGKLFLIGNLCMLIKLLDPVHSNLLAPLIVLCENFSNAVSPIIAILGGKKLHSPERPWSFIS